MTGLVKLFVREPRAYFEESFARVSLGFPIGVCLSFKFAGVLRLLDVLWHRGEGGLNDRPQGSRVAGLIS